MSATRVFELQRAVVTLAGNEVIRNIDFRLDTGEFLALLGANGSGKTTLLRAVLGLVPLSSGKACIFDGRVEAFRQWSRVGYVPQRAFAAPSGAASVLEVVMSGRIARSHRLRRYAAADRSAALRALQLVGLDEIAGASVARLSGGQQQRVLVARALAGEPDALVLDEPVSGVDLEHQERLTKALHDFHQHGGSVLLVAHGLGLMEDLVTREIVMEQGVVVYDGPHHPHHVHPEHVHHTAVPSDASPLDRAARAK